MAVKSSLPSSELASPHSTAEESESLWVSIHTAQTRELHLCTFCKPPSAPSTRLDFLAQSVLALYRRNKKSHPHIIIAGDFNFSDINWKSEPPMPTNPATGSDMNTLLDFIEDNALTQHVTEPTRPVSLKTPDLVLSSTPTLISDVSVVPGMSDHDIVTFTINTNPRKTSEPPHKVYRYKSANMDGLHKDMTDAQEDFLNKCQTRSVDENWTLFKTSIHKAMDTNIPYKITKAKPQVPWMTRPLKCQMRKMDKLLKKARHNNSTTAWRDCRQQRNKVVKLLRNAHKDYLTNTIAANLNSSPKKFWQHAKRSRSESTDIPTLRKSSNQYISDKGKANALNAQFQSLFTSDNGLSPSLDTREFSAIGSIEFGVQGAQKQLEQLNVHKLTGPDEIPAQVLKMLSHEIAPMLTFIFQQSYNSGAVPYDWTKAMVVPIFKSGSRADPSNHRPISLTCISCKVMEHIVLSHINKHLTVNNIITSFQHGFRQGLSCESQLILATHDWATVPNNCSQTDVLLLDFSKAFDKVSHPKMIQKLEHCGITGKTM